MHHCICLAAEICNYSCVICKHTRAVLKGVKGLIRAESRSFLMVYSGV